MRRVWKTHGEVRLLIAGPIPPVSRVDDLRLHELTEQERSKIVTISAFKDEEKPSIFDALDVFVLPSVGESFGIAYLEAWVCGKPVIGARIGPTSNVINEHVDGLLVDPADPVDLAGKILELLSDPSKRERMGHSGRNKTLTRFTWDRIIDEMERIYGDVTNGR